jgi:cysteine synthase A
LPPRRRFGDISGFLKHLCDPQLAFSTSAMSSRSRYYIVGAFLLGVALTTAYNKKSSSEASDNGSAKLLLKQQQDLLSKISKCNDLETLKKSLAGIENSAAEGEGNIREGIEGCIGNTPLFKIKSLSEYTGCDILVKAEVGTVTIIDKRFC